MHGWVWDLWDEKCCDEIICWRVWDDAIAHAEGADGVMDEHASIHKSKVAHSKEVVEEVATGEYEDVLLESGVLLPALTVQEVGVVPGKEHTDCAVDARDYSITHVQHVCSREMWVWEFSVHDNQVDNIPDYKWENQNFNVVNWSFG